MRFYYQPYPGMKIYARNPKLKGCRSREDFMRIMGPKIVFKNDPMPIDPTQVFAEARSIPMYFLFVVPVLSFFSMLFLPHTMPKYGSVIFACIVLTSMALWAIFIIRYNYRQDFRARMFNLTPIPSTYPDHEAKI